LEQFRSLVASEVCEKISQLQDIRSMKERMAKIEEDLGILVLMLKQEEHARADLKTIKGLLSQ
jgi:hypothetical protein